MTQHIQLSEESFKEAVQNTATFKAIENKVFQNLYFKPKILDEFFQNYKWAVREGINHLKQKKSVSGRNINIIAEILKL